MRLVTVFLGAAALLPTALAAQMATARSAPIGNIRYEITFDAASARTQTVKVTMTFDVTGGDPVLLSLPAWTPGAYEVSNFSRWVSAFTPTAGGKELTWDKLDYDTWRIRPAGARSVTVSFDYLADSLDNAIAWAQPNFAFFNGTNILPYAEGRGYDFPATVMVKTEDDWLVATGMTPGAAPRTYRVASYHELVDKPFFVGRFDLDSAQVAGHTTRLATYPAGALAGAARTAFWNAYSKVIPAESAVFQETPWDTYTTLVVFQPSYPGGSALEHTNSHLSIYADRLIGSPVIDRITAHEIFHAWNVKRLRPAEMVPYAYDRTQPTTLLWVSEGITDYYADLAVVRSGVVDSAAFLEQVMSKIQQVSTAPPVALEDASLSTWIHPTDGTGYLYYPKGSLAGLMLDIRIRDASDNRASLDDVMRELYRTTYKQGKGFTVEQWWAAVGKAAGGKSFTDFYAKYVDGREPYPWAEVLPRAGLRYVQDSIAEPRLGIQTAGDSAGGSRITGVAPGGAAADAGVEPGDLLVALGDLTVTNDDFGPAFRSRYAGKGGQDLPIVVVRDGRRMTLIGKVRLVTRDNTRIEFDPNASEKAVRIRNGILTGK